MAGRHSKQGIDYFPVDVGFFTDIKIRKISRACGANSISILLCLLCNIYKDEGYYILWDEDLPFVIADMVGVSEGTVKETLLKALQVNFFSKEMYDKYKILTSYGVQKRFLLATYQRKETEIIPKYLINCTNNAINCANNSIVCTENEQSKVKVNRKNKLKENTPNGVSKKDVLSLSQTEKIDYSGLMDFFNKKFKDKLPAISSMTDKRKKAVRARAAENGKRSIATVFENVLQSKFLIGHNSSNWHADFDWIFRPTNFIKILEGNYNDEDNARTAADYIHEKQEENKRMKEKFNEREKSSITHEQYLDLKERAKNGDKEAEKLLKGA